MKNKITIEELEKENKRLKLENKFLSELSLKEKLINLIFELISKNDDEQIIFREIAFTIKKYLEIEFSGFFVLKRNRLQSKITFSDKKEINIELDSYDIEALLENQIIEKKISSIDTNIFIFPINSVVENYFFVIYDKLKYDLIKSFKQSIEKIIFFLATKIENIYYLRELLDLNKCLELKIKEKTEELSNKNIQLKEQNEELKKLNEDLSNANKKLLLTLEELKKAKEKAEESNRLKSSFIKNLSHEIRTPINAINGFAELIFDTSLSEDKLKNYIKILKESALQLLKIINDILEISRLDIEKIEVNKEKIYLNNLILNLFTKFSLRAKEKNLNLYIDNTLENRNLYFVSDNFYINKIFDKIIDNALKNTLNGNIIIKTQLTDKKILEISVSDTGKGIPKEKLEKIFEPFYTIDDHTSGLGLGLSICKKYAELLNLQLIAESELHKGSTFTLKIPLNGDNIKRNTENRLKILIAEDDEINLFYLNQILEKYDNNIEILQACNGKEAVDVFKKNKDVSLILMDLKMPVLDGFEAIKIIRSISTDVPIVVQSAYSSVDDKKRAKDLGCTEFLSKPIRKNMLFAIVDRILKIKK
jgi:signal transduction histidine kinase